MGVIVVVSKLPKMVLNLNVHHFWGTWLPQKSGPGFKKVVNCGHLWYFVGGSRRPLFCGQTTKNERAHDHKKERAYLPRVCPSPGLPVRESRLEYPDNYSGF